VDDLVEQARAFAADWYGSDSELEHPLEVAQLVEAAGFEPDVVAAAVLHDLVEDTDADMRAIRMRFGPRVAELVSAMTEDESISGYRRRKREHRGRVSRAGRDAAAIFVADKVSNSRRMRRGQKRLEARKLGHYAATLELMRSEWPDLPLLGELERELDAVRVDLQRLPA
jgi:(p)ppGpp synthase/HD superfamily hydrolase